PDALGTPPHARTEPGAPRQTSPRSRHARSGGPRSRPRIHPRDQREDGAMKNYLNHETTIWSWLSTKDHKRIGVMFLVSVTLFLLVGGVFALILRLEHLTPDSTIVSANMYNQLFTLHGVVMVWLFLIPAIPTGFG